MGPDIKRRGATGAGQQAHPEDSLEGQAGPTETSAGGGHVTVPLTRSFRFGWDQPGLHAKRNDFGVVTVKRDANLRKIRRRCVSACPNPAVSSQVKPSEAQPQTIQRAEAIGILGLMSRLATSASL
jgi:hypothetical protein